MYMGEELTHDEHIIQVYSSYEKKTEKLVLSGCARFFKLL